MNLKQLAKVVEAEGKNAARRCRRGEFTRAELQAEYDKHGDIEARIALDWLDKWGIK